MTAPRKGSDVTEAELRTSLLNWVEERGTGRTFCPSEVVRRLCPEDWRELMAPLRKVAETLRKEGRIRVFQRGVEQSTVQVSGPIRLGK